jgi:hypothetical protein
MWFERRSLPSRRDVIMRVMAVALLAWILYVVPGHDELNSRSLFGPGATVWVWVWVLLECVIVILVAAIGAHVEKSRGSRQSNVVMAVLAYVAARALTDGLDHPRWLSSWSPYPMSHWLQYADFLLLGVFLQAWILRPLFPVFLFDAGKIRRWAAVILCVLPFLLWDWLTGPRLLTFADVAAELTRATGREIGYLPVTAAQYADAALAAGVPAGEIEPLSELFARVLDGHNAHLTDGVELVLGRRPRDFAGYAHDTAATGVWSPAAAGGPR